MEPRLQKTPLPNKEPKNASSPSALPKREWLLWSAYLRETDPVLKKKAFLAFLHLEEEDGEREPL